MAKYLCEDNLSCRNFQSAICLHCNRRLCVEHIHEHSEIIPGSFNNISNDLEHAFQEVNNTYEKSRETYNNMLSSLSQWRVQQTEKIQQIYDTKLNSIESQQRTLNLLHKNLTDELEHDARRELKSIESEKDNLMKKLDIIRQTISKVRRNSTQLKWKFSSLPQNICLEQLQRHSVSVRTSKSSSYELPWRKHVIRFSSHRMINLRKFRSFKRLVDMFSNLSSIEESKTNITSYLTLQGSAFPLPILVSSYLAAWYRKTDPNEKNLILKEYMPTIWEPISSHNSGYIFLLGIYGFFYNEPIRERKRDIMTFLLHYFTSQNCITRDQILIWYNYKDLRRCLDFDGAKLLMTPYVESLSNNNSETNIQTVFENGSTIKSSGILPIKNEPKGLTETKS